MDKPDTVTLRADDKTRQEFMDSLAQWLISSGFVNTVAYGELRIIIKDKVPQNISLEQNYKPKLKTA